MTESHMLWQPSKDRAEKTQMFALMTELAKRHGFQSAWPAFHAWSVDRSDLFWREMLEFAQIRAHKPATATRIGKGMLGTQWFPGMQLNFAEHLLRFRDDRVAIEAEDELGRTRSLTYQELYEKVAQLAVALRNVGVSKGDRVAGFMPNIPEAVIAMLAATSLGAIWSSCSPDFGINGVFDRFSQIEPKALFAADGYSYNGKTIDTLERTAGIVEKIPSIKHVVISPFMSESPNVAAIPGASIWSTFISERGGSNAPENITFESVPYDHPVYIMYSSGTTGVPKCIVHGVGGTLLQHMKELILHCDLRREDTIFYFTTCGWMMWNWLVSSLGVGATVVLYEGSPFYPRPDHLWKMTERLGLSVFGTSPKYIAACEKVGIVPKAMVNLEKLQAVLSTGAPLTDENFAWVYENVKEDLQLSSISGGTDIISCFALGNPIMPVYAGELQCLGLGMDVQAFNDTGKPVVDEKGELVCCSAFPSQPTGFWNDPDDEKYRKTYFDHYPGIWRHGDYMELTHRGGVIMYGRSDATLNPGGVRIGTSEIYRQVETLEEVLDSVVVGRRTADADIDVCLFVVLREGVTLDQDLTDHIKKHIAEGASKRHVPKHIRQVSAVPYTISGKKVELAVQQMIHGETVPNRDALSNPESLDQYAGIL